MRVLTVGPENQSCCHTLHPRGVDLARPGPCPLCRGTEPFCFHLQDPEQLQSGHGNPCPGLTSRSAGEAARSPATQPPTPQQSPNSAATACLGLSILSSCPQHPSHSGRTKTRTAHLYPSPVPQENGVGPVDPLSPCVPTAGQRDTGRQLIGARVLKRGIRLLGFQNRGDLTAF